MYAIMIIRYRKPLDEVAAVTPAHRAYLAELHDRGLLLASGPFDPRTGGLLLFRLPDGDMAELERIRDGDPFRQNGIADYELQRWNPVIGTSELDGLGAGEGRGGSAPR